MRKSLVMMLLILTVGCQEKSADSRGNGTGNPPARAGQIDSGLADASNRFGFKLLGELDDPDGVMISPACIAMALTMTYNGAAGATQSQMASALEVSGFSLNDLNDAHRALRRILTDSSSDVTLNIANSLWARAGLVFDSTFFARNTEYFDAEITNLDFDLPQSVDDINGWVNDQTKGKISQIIDRINSETILFLINAIYFKGTWTYTFNKNLTYNDIFHHASGDRQRQFMLQEGKFQYLNGDGFQAIRLPYGKSQRFGMYVFLPSEESSIAQFTESLTESTWKEWMGRFSSSKGAIHLPRFTVTYDKGLKEPLMALGMSDAFSPTAADFSKMITVPGENVYISAVKHKTFMEVNEEGTEAAAVTSVEVGVTSFPGPQDPFVMIVNRPFFCAITDQESGLILFMGVVNEYQ